MGPWGSYDVVEVGMGDEEEVLMDSSGVASANIEDGIEGWDYEAGLVASNREAFHEKALGCFDALPVNLRPRLPVLLLFLDGEVDGRQQSRPFDGGWTVEMISAGRDFRVRVLKRRKRLVLLGYGFGREK